MAHLGEMVACIIIALLCFGCGVLCKIAIDLVKNLEKEDKEEAMGTIEYISKKREIDFINSCLAHSDKMFDSEIATLESLKDHIESAEVIKLKKSDSTAN